MPHTAAKPHPVKLWREQRGLSRYQLARKAHMSFTGIQKIEEGRSNPRYSSLLTLSVALGVPVEALSDEA